MIDLYQELILFHNRNPRNCAEISCPTCRAEGFNHLCGDSVVVSLKIENNIITDVFCKAIGCALCVSSGSLLTEAIKNKTVDEAKDIFKKLHALVTGKSNDTGGLGKLEVFHNVSSYPSRVKCTLLSCHAFKDAIKDI